MSKNGFISEKKTSTKKTKQNYSKTIEALSRMAEGVGNHNNVESQEKQRSQFGGLKNVKLADFISDNNPPSKEDASETSIYMGAGLKLDAFDCFHKALNKCANDYTFSVTDAAYFLKQLSPNIIKKLIPIIKHNALLHSNKTSQTDFIDGDGSIDLEVSELTKKPKQNPKSDKPKSSIKRPDASRPTRMLSPGSNSCSPVSAAVQALISISAPVTKQTNIVINSRNSKIKPSKHIDHIQQAATFVPLSKPPTIMRDFNSENVFLPVHKPEAVMTNCTNNNTPSNSTTPDQEVSEVMSVQKRNIDNASKPYGNSSSVCATSYSSPLNTVMTTKSQNRFTDYISKQNMNYNFYNSNKVGIDGGTVSAPEDPLPQFSLLLGTPSLPVDMSCGLSSPYGQVLPTPSMPSMPHISQNSPHLHQLPGQQQQQQQQQQLHNPPACQESPTIPMQTSITSQISTISQNPNMDQQSVQQSIESSIITSVSNIQQHLEHHQAMIDQAYNNEQHSAQQLRTILPKPYDQTSGNLTLMSVLPPSIASTMLTPPSSTTANSNNNTLPADQLSTAMKLEERFNIHNITIPPNQIFTKMNLHPNHRALLQNLTFPPNFQSLISNEQPNEQIIQPHQQQTTQANQQEKSQKQYSSLNQMPHNVFPMTVNKEDKNIMLFERQSDNVISSDTVQEQATPVQQQKRRGSKHSDNGGGQLEVASALLSMGTESGTSMDIATTDDASKLTQQNIEALIGSSLGSSDVTMTYGTGATFKLDDVDIDPNFHTLKKDNFTCGKCKRVFTSIMYLARHIKRVCPDMSQRKWKCDKCSKAFRHPFGLQQHMFTHTGERPHKCSHCTKAFYSANDLRRHERTHSGERPYECPQCNKRFSTTISLKTHTYIHTGERPHRCPHCPKTFATSSKLSRHSVTHSAERPYPCDQCPKTFNRSGDLRKHYTQHSGKAEALLQCDQCNKSFATQKCLLQHKTTHNKGNNQVWMT